MSEPTTTPVADEDLRKRLQQAITEQAAVWEDGIGLAVGVPDAATVVARVIRDAAQRIRAMADNYPEDVFPSDGTTRDAISAAAMRHAYKVAADMLIEGVRADA